MSEEQTLYGWHEAIQALVFGTDKGPVAISVQDLARHDHGWKVSADNLRRCLPRVDPPMIEQAPALGALRSGGYGRPRLGRS